MVFNKLKSSRSCQGPVCVAVSALLATTASAQTAAVTNAVINAVTATVTTNQVARLEKPRSLSITYGAFDFHPRLKTATYYDDNIQFAKHDPKSAVITHVAPGIQVVGGDRQSLYENIERYTGWDQNGSLSLWNLKLDLDKLTPSWWVIKPAEDWPGKFLLLDYSPRWQNFSQYSGNNSLDQFLTFDAVWPMAKLVVGFQQIYTDQKEVILEAQTRSEVRQIKSQLDAGYRISEKFSADSTWTREEVDYPGTTSLVGYTEWKGNLSLNLQALPKLNISLVTAGGLDEVVSGQNQQFVQMGGRARYDLTQLFEVDASLGWEYRQYDTGHSAVLSPYFNLSAVYKPWERVSLRLGVQRRNYASLFQNNYYTSTGGFLDLRRSYTERFSLQAYLDYGYIYYMNTQNGGSSKPLAPTDDYTLKVSANYSLLKHLTSKVYYQFLGSGLSVNQNEVKDNQVGFDRVHFSGPVHELVLGHG